MVTSCRALQVMSIFCSLMLTASAHRVWVAIWRYGGLREVCYWHFQLRL